MVPRLYLLPTRALACVPLTPPHPPRGGVSASAVPHTSSTCDSASLHLPQYSHRFRCFSGTLWPLVATLVPLGSRNVFFFFRYPCFSIPPKENHSEASTYCVLTIKKANSHFVTEFGAQPQPHHLCLAVSTHTCC